MSSPRSSGRSLQAFCVAAALLVAGCTNAVSERQTSPHASVTSAGQSPSALAVATVFSLPGVGDSSMFEPFPRRSGRGTCQIPTGGLVATRLPGTCETRVERSAENWLVILVETWDARDFRGQNSPATGPLTHSWEFTVGTEGGIVAMRNWGDFPPQWVR